MVHNCAYEHACCYNYINVPNLVGQALRVASLQATVPSPFQAMVQELMKYWESMQAAEGCREFFCCTTQQSGLIKGLQFLGIRRGEEKHIHLTPWFPLKQIAGWFGKDPWGQKKKKKGRRGWLASTIIIQRIRKKQRNPGTALSPPEFLGWNRFQDALKG